MLMIIFSNPPIFFFCYWKFFWNTPSTPHDVFVLLLRRWMSTEKEQLQARKQELEQEKQKIDLELNSIAGRLQWLEIQDERDQLIQNAPSGATVVKCLHIRIGDFILHKNAPWRVMVMQRSCGGSSHRTFHLLDSQKTRTKVTKLSNQYVTKLHFECRIVKVHANDGQTIQFKFVLCEEDCNECCDECPRDETFIFPLSQFRSLYTRDLTEEIAVQVCMNQLFWS